MSSYNSLAGWYDRLTEDVNYESFADYYESKFGLCGQNIKLVLDLCCGTGTLSFLMAERGYEMIAVDASPDMLMEAQGKAASYDNTPLFICQAAEDLDLYGTVDAAFSSLDSLNYIPPDSIDEVFRRLSLFVRPGGILIFDVRKDDWLKDMDGYISIDEDDDVFCVWRADYSIEESCLTYGVDLFVRNGRTWERSQEEHMEYPYSGGDIERLLSNHGFRLLSAESDVTAFGPGRVIYTALREK